MFEIPGAARGIDISLLLLRLTVALVIVQAVSAI